MINFGFIPTGDYGRVDKQGLYEESAVLGTGRGQLVLLYKYLEQLIGPTSPRDQGKGSDCVGQATARGVDVLSGVQIAGMGLAQSFIAQADASSIYGGSRYEIGRLRHGYRFRGHGSQVPFAAEFVRDFGCLYMQEYKELGLDLSTHSWARSEKWGSGGLPDEFEPTAKLHGIGAYTPIRSWPELCDAIANGWPVVVGSSFGFKGQKDRDADGFLEPNGKWMHAMIFTGIDDSSDRPGACCENSWGRKWVLGPKRHGQPDGSFWVDADVVEDMCRSGEAVALSQHAGFKPNYNV